MKHLLPFSLAALAVLPAVVGCASQVPTTDKWAISKGFERVETQGREYFCRQQPMVTDSNRSSVTCLTLGQLMVARWAGPPASEGFPYDVPAAPNPPYLPVDTVESIALGAFPR